MPVTEKNGVVNISGGGTGTVTSITAGFGIVCTPDPITGAGVVSLYVAPTPPSVSLVLSPAAGLYEFPLTPIALPQLTPTTVEGTNPITTLTLSRSGTGLIYTYPTPSPTGGTEAPFTDMSGGVAVDTTYTATVGDGTLTGTGTAAYSFCYPIYFGVGADGLDGAGIRALTHLLAIPGTMTLTFSPNANRVYFAYPATAPDLASILDINSFNVTADFPQTLINITGLDLTVQSYKVYEINHNVGTGLPTTYTFNF